MGCSNIKGARPLAGYCVAPRLPSPILQSIREPGGRRHAVHELVLAHAVLARHLTGASVEGAP